MTEDERGEYCISVMINGSRFETMIYMIWNLFLNKHWNTLEEDTNLRVTEKNPDPKLLDLTTVSV